MSDDTIDKTAIGKLVSPSDDDFEYHSISESEYE